MIICMKKGLLEKIIYGCKYTAGSYADVLMSLPIVTSEYLCRGVEKSFQNKTPDFFKWNYTQEKSPTYKTRETLREKLDTELGVKFIQSSLVSVIPFFLVGMPAAEAATSLVEKYTPEMGELSKCITNSFCTLGVQTAVGYTAFMANEIRINKDKYQNEYGKLSPKKIAVGFGRVIKTFLSLDMIYVFGKTGLQTYFLLKGKDPWKASGIADSIGIPFFWVFMISLGLHTGLIETKETKNWK